MTNISGTLGGYAWSENKGWIDFGPAAAGVVINGCTGVFSGRAWSEHAGWITFSSTGPNPYQVATSWRLNCHDNNACTDDNCNAATGCAHTNNTASCNDGNACTTSDSCGGGVCVGGPPPALPTSTAGLTMQRGIVGLTWLPIPDATGYDVVLGDLGVLRTSGGDFATATQECLANDQASTELVYTVVPDAGSGFFFLVRGTNCSGSGTYDSGSPGQVASCDAGVEAAPITCSTTCARDKCVLGPASDQGCGGCVASICAVDAYCCNSAWDSICVGEVTSICGKTCN